MTVLAPPLDRISREARPYPSHLLPEGGTGLCLFAAAFLGHNDAIHMARRNMTVTCVDTDLLRLDEMRDLYPSDWTFVWADAWSFARGQEERPGLTYRPLGAVGPVQWDVVSVDTFTGDAERRSLASLNLWCSLARSVVTVTATEQALGTFRVPDGWTDSLFERAPGVYWLVLERL